MSKTVDRVDKPNCLYPTENDMSLDHRTNLVSLMNEGLASAVDLKMQMKHARWNVKVPSYIALHELFHEPLPRPYGRPTQPCPGLRVLVSAPPNNAWILLVLTERFGRCKIIDYRSMFSLIAKSAIRKWSNTLCCAQIQNTKLLP
jgi:hypothetical protein